MSSSRTAFIFAVTAFSISACSRVDQTTSKTTANTQPGFNILYPSRSLPLPQYAGSKVVDAKETGNMVEVTLSSGDSPRTVKTKLESWFTSNGWQVRDNIASLTVETGKPPANINDLVKKDFEYQTATALFYAQRYDQAKECFLAIAKDKTSPWHKIAPYLAARALVRKSSIQQDYSDVATLRQAKDILVSMNLAEQSVSMRKEISDLLDLVECRMLDMRTADESLKKSGSAFGKKIDDITLVMDRILERGPGAVAAYEQTPPQLISSDLGDWVFCFSRPGDKAFQHAVSRWKSTRSPWWLLATISMAEPADAEAASLLQDVEAVARSSLAYPTLKYHQIRVLVASGRFDEARDSLQSLDKIQMTETNRNLLKALRARTAQSVSELVKDCTVRPVAVFSEPDQYFPGVTATSSAAVFDPNTVSILNDKCPLSVLKDAALDSSLPKHLKQEAISSVWVRAALLNNDSVAKILGAELTKIKPELTPVISAYQSASSPEDRRFAAVFAILKYPGFHPYIRGGLLRRSDFAKIDDLRDNWWTDPQGAQFARADSEKYDFSNDSDPVHRRGDVPSLEAPAFLTEEQRARAEDEVRDLTQLGDTPTFLTKEVLARTKVRPDDVRLPEALHQAIICARHIDTQADTESLSKEAFTLLQKRYPKSSWAKKTKFYY